MKSHEQKVAEWITAHGRRIEMKERDVLEALTDSQVRVWLPWALGLRTIEELCDELGKSEENISSTLSRAQGRLLTRIMEVPE